MKVLWLDKSLDTGGNWDELNRSLIDRVGAERVDRMRRDVARSMGGCYDPNIASVTELWNWVLLSGRARFVHESLPCEWRRRRSAA